MYKNLKNSKQETPKGYVSDSTEEQERLIKQDNLFKKFDDEIWNKLLKDKKKLDILDVGCNCGNLIFDRVGGRHEYRNIVGIDYYKDNIDFANKNFGSANRHFYLCDVEDISLENSLKMIMDQNNIKKFDIIHLSLILLHLKEPQKLLERLKDFLGDSGTILIKDVDDGLNFAYPDENKDFDRIYEICSIDNKSGDRRTGRKLYSYLTNAGYDNVKIEKIGQNSINLSEEEKLNMYDVYFSFILANAEERKNEFPQNKKYQEDWEWFSQNYEKLKNKFLEKDFIFNLGLMAFTASPKK